MSAGEAFRKKLDQALDETNAKRALRLLDDLVSKHPKELQARFERAMALLNLDRDDEALTDLEQVLKADASYPGARDWYARVQAGRGKPFLAAEAKLKALTEAAPEHWSANGQAWNDCAIFFVNAGEPQRALDALATYFKSYEGKQAGYERYLPAPYRAQALALMALERPDEALVPIERACADAHSVPADRFVRARVLAMQGKRDEALTEINALRGAYAGTAPWTEAKDHLATLHIAID